MRLVALFPRSWRQRYGEEFEALLEETRLSPRDVVDVLHGVWDAHVRPQPHLGMGGTAMSASVTRGLWSVPAALAALVLLVAGQTVVTASVAGPGLGFDPSVLWLAAAGVVLGAAAAVLWRWGRLLVLWVFLALLAVRSLQLSLTWLLLERTTDPLRALYWEIDPLGLGWLPPTLFQVAVGVALVVALARWLRLRPLTAVIVGLTLELLLGTSDLSLISFLRIHGLDEAMFMVGGGPAPPSQIGSALSSPTPYLLFLGPVVWALTLQQVALRSAGAGAPRPLARAYVGFVRDHWAPLAALAVAVALARFSLPGYLTSTAFLNPAHFTPTGTDVQAQFRDCLKAYGVDLPPGASTKTAAIPAGAGTRCSNIINSYPSQVRGRPQPVPAPVTAGGVTYTVTSVQVAGNVLKIDWQAYGPRIDEFGAAAYPARPPSEQQGASARLVVLDMQYLRSSVLDSAGNHLGGYGGGGQLPRTKPYAWHGETTVLIPGPGQYTMALGCAVPVQFPLAKGSPDGACTGGPNATITILVS